jgi:hypothetical protein
MRQNLTEVEKQNLQDRLFLVEICNDLARNGSLGEREYSKADTMLKDWGKELKAKTRTIFPSSRLKKVFCEVVGPNLF